MKTPATVSQPQTPASLVSAVFRLLRPLIRLLICHGMTYPHFCRMLKRIYIETAEKDFSLVDRQLTASRVHVLTGLHRKDIAGMRSDAPAGYGKAAATSSLGALLVSRWTGDPRFLDRQGQPRPLPRHGGKGESVSFVRLVEELSSNVRSRAILDEWLRLGVARLDQEGMVHLRVAAFVPDAGFDEKAFFLGENVRAHLEACVHNLSGDGDPEPERNVYYDGLSLESIQRLRDIAREEGMRSLQEINRQAFLLQQEDKKKASARWRMRFGIYWHQELQGAEEKEQ